MTLCWRCGKHYFENPATGNCIYCGYSQDQAHEREVKIQQLIHDLMGENISVYTTYVPTFHRRKTRWGANRFNVSRKGKNVSRGEK